MQYTYGGFGVLIWKNTLDVLVWKNSKFTNSDTTIRNVSYFDTYLNASFRDSITKKGVFEYKDPKGFDWIVAAHPFFVPGSDSIDPSSPLNNLVILVFAQRPLALKSLDTLHTNIASTISDIIETTCIIIAATVAVTLVFVFLIIHFISAPLEGMLRLSEELIEMSAEDDENKDYRAILQRLYCNLERRDEIGILAIDYYYLVHALHNQHADMEELKFPLNPFHIPPPDDNRNTPYTVTWPQFVSVLNNIDPQENASSAEDVTPELPPAAPMNIEDFFWPLPKEKSPEYTNLELAARKEQQNTGTQRATSRRYIQIPTNSEDDLQVGWFTSLKSQLYFLAVALLVGNIIVMIMTAVPLSSQQSDSWMKESTPEIDSNQVLNMQAITVAKSAYVKVR